MKTRFELRIENNLLRDIKIKAAQEETSISELIVSYILKGIALERFNSRFDNKIKDNDMFQCIEFDLEDEYK